MGFSLHHVLVACVVTATLCTAAHAAIAENLIGSWHFTGSTGCEEIDVTATSITLKANDFNEVCTIEAIVDGAGSWDGFTQLQTTCDYEGIDASVCYYLRRVDHRLDIAADGPNCPEFSSSALNHATCGDCNGEHCNGAVTTTVLSAISVAMAVGAAFWFQKHTM